MKECLFCGIEHTNKKYCSRECYTAHRRENPKTDIHTCQQCGDNFSDPKHPNRKYCSRECSNEAKCTRDMSPRPCVTCGAMIENPHRESQRFCSSQCFGDANRYPPQICEFCGEEFEYTCNSANRFCSYECMGKAQRNRVVKVCEVCGTKFEVVASKADKLYCCSRECGYKRRHRDLTCEQCGETVSVRAHFVESGKYAARFCSYECAADWQKGENHSNWQGGHDKWRGPNWNRQKSKARKRDNNTCQHCGTTEGELGRPMDVHHITPWREFDHDWKRANKLGNLISLCPTCHTTIERNDDIVIHPHTHTIQSGRMSK